MFDDKSIDFKPAGASGTEIKQQNPNNFK